MTVTSDLAAQNVQDVVKAAYEWLYVNMGPTPNRSATTWRVGEWNIELAYVYGEGRMHLWLDGHPGRTLVTRGRNDADLQLWLDALEACKP